MKIAAAIWSGKRGWGTVGQPGASTGGRAPQGSQAATRAGASARARSRRSQCLSQLLSHPCRGKQSWSRGHCRSQRRGSQRRSHPCRGKRSWNGASAAATPAAGSGVGAAATAGADVPATSTAAAGQADHATAVQGSAAGQADHSSPAENRAAAAKGATTATTAYHLRKWATRRSCIIGVRNEHMDKDQCGADA